MDAKLREIRTKNFSEITTLDLKWLYKRIDELERNNKMLANDLLQQIELTQGRVKKLVDENQRYKKAIQGIEILLKQENWDSYRREKSILDLIDLAKGDLIE